MSANLYVDATSMLAIESFAGATSACGAESEIEIPTNAAAMMADSFIFWLPCLRSAQ